MTTKNNGLRGVGLKRLFFSLALLVATNVWAHSPVGNAQSIHVYTEPLPPYKYHENYSHLDNAISQKVHDIFVAAGLHPEFFLAPWARAYAEVLKDNDGLIFAMAKNAEREPHFYWLAEVTEFQLGFVALSSRDDIVIDELKDAAQYRVSVHRGGVGQKWIGEHARLLRGNVTISADEASAWESLIDGRVDLIIADPRSLQNALAVDVNFLDMVTVVREIPELSMKGYLAANKNIDPEILAKLQQAVRQVSGQQKGE